MLHRLLVLIALAGCSSAPPAAPPPAAPSATVLKVPFRTLAGASTNLEHLTRGNVTLVSLWATWCEACKDELPALIRLDERARAGKEFRVVAIAVGDELPKVEAFVGEHPMPFAGYLDENFDLSGALGSNRVPTTLVVDRTGAIVFTGAGLDHAALDALQKALGDSR